MITDQIREPARQASEVMNDALTRIKISAATAHAYEQALIRVAEYVRDTCVCADLRALSFEHAIEFLKQRSAAVSKKTIDMDRNAIHCMFRYVTNKLGVHESLPIIQPERQVKKRKAYIYTPEQVRLIVAAQNQRNAMATEIAYAAGLRAHELLTLRLAHEQSADQVIDTI